MTVRCMYPGHHGDLARALGQASWNHQVRFVGIYPSVAAFVRALLDARLAGGTAGSVTRYLRQYGYIDRHPTPTALLPEVLYVCRDMGNDADLVRVDDLPPWSDP